MNRVFDEDFSNDFLNDNDQWEHAFSFERSGQNEGFLQNMITNDEETQKYDEKNQILNLQCLEKQNESTFKRKMKTKRKAFGDYRKNICGYITKKIIREFISLPFKQNVCNLCEKYGCDYEIVQGFYINKIERITGPSHLPSLFVSETKQQIPIKKVCGEFFMWFLKQRYIRYLLLEGKMEKKQAYIQYKNQVLIRIIQAQRQQELNAFEFQFEKIE